MTRNKKAKKDKPPPQSGQHAAPKTAAEDAATALMAAADQAMLRGDVHVALDKLLAAYEAAPQLATLERKLNDVLAVISRLETERAQPPSAPPTPTPSASGSQHAFKSKKQRRKRRGGSGEESHSSQGQFAAALQADVAELLSDVAQLAARFLRAVAPDTVGLLLVTVALYAWWKALAGNLVGALGLWALSCINTQAVADKLGVYWIRMPLFTCKLVAYPFWWLCLQSRSWAFTGSVLALLAHYHVGNDAQYLVIVPSLFLRAAFAFLPALWALLSIIACSVGLFRLLARVSIGEADGGHSGAWEETFATFHARGGVHDVCDADEHGHGLSKVVPKGASDPEVRRILGCATWHAVLQVSAGASVETIRQAGRKKVLVTHPDKCKDAHAARAFRRVISALSVLSDENKRCIYEAGLRRHGQGMGVH
jgi:DnaJ domain